jgi:hypothetical protein
MAHEDLLKIHCTTTVIIRNTKTNKIYKDEAEKEMLILLTLIRKQLQNILHKMLRLKYHRKD